MLLVFDAWMSSRRDRQLIEGHSEYTRLGLEYKEALSQIIVELARLRVYKAWQRDQEGKNGLGVDVCIWQY